MKKIPIGAALSSYGMSGEVFHGPLLSAHTGFKIEAVFHRTLPSVVRHNYRVVHSFNDILSDPAIELVIVNTPNDSHHRYALEALAAGKHVVVEKPFTVTVNEANELIQLARKVGKLLTVFQNRRWDADFLTVRNIIERGVLGKIVEFESHYDRFRNTIDPKSWKDEPRAGTGLLYNLGSHMIDQALILFGMPQFLDARLGIQRPGGKVHDFYDLRLTYADKLVILKSSYLVKEQGPRYAVHGTNGSFVKYGIDPQEEDLKSGKTPGTNGWGAEALSDRGRLNTIDINEAIESIPGNYLAFYDNLYEAVRQGRPLAVKPGESRDVIAIIEACFESNKSRCAIPML